VLGRAGWHETWLQRCLRPLQETQPRQVTPFGSHYVFNRWYFCSCCSSSYFFNLNQPPEPSSLEHPQSTYLRRGYRLYFVLGCLNH
jgi:hypothetical protein